MGRTEVDARGTPNLEPDGTISWTPWTPLQLAEHAAIPVKKPRMVKPKNFAPEPQISSITPSFDALIAEATAERLPKLNKPRGNN